MDGHAQKTEGEMVGWHHRLNGHEFEQAPGDGNGQGSLACYSPWGCKEPDTTGQLNNDDSYLKWIPNKTSYTAQGTLLSFTGQPGRAGSLGENGYMYVYG